MGRAWLAGRNSRPEEEEARGAGAEELGGMGKSSSEDHLRLKDRQDNRISTR